MVDQADLEAQAKNSDEYDVQRTIDGNNISYTHSNYARLSHACREGMKYNLVLRVYKHSCTSCELRRPL